MSDYPFTPIAVVGVGAIMPDAPSADAFWANIRNGRYSITETPPERWDPALYYDADPSAPDKTYSKIGGWVREFDWSPMVWRLPIPPKVSDQLDIGQQWSVAGSRMALMDAGFPDWGIDPERVAVIIGNAIGGEKHYASNLRIESAEFFRALASTDAMQAMPVAAREALLAQARAKFLEGRAPINEDSMPGELANIIAGRVAALFNFRGPNFTTDAACASGLAGMSAAVQGLQTHAYDAVITGGVDRNMGISAFVKFCKIGALSATGTRPFDAGADGFVMGEGAALFVLRRLADAERDGQHVYGVIRGLAGSSDGKGKGITAPNPVGQKLAVERAWAAAEADPTTAGYIEAHGTSTRVGDAAELTTLNEVFLKAGAQPGTIGLGSVKSNIGHLKAAAGTAGFFKAIRSLDEKVLAPSLNFVDPNPRVDWDASPFRVNTELRDWPVGPDGVRRAGVSAFGFGGTNFHVVVEEYVPGRLREESAPRSFASAQVPQQAAAPPVASSSASTVKSPLRGALVLGGSTDAELVALLRTVAADAAAGIAPPATAPDPALADAAVRLAIDYADADDLAKKAEKALKAFAADNAAMWKMLRAQGVFVGRGPAPKVAFLYTGQGSQYVNMLDELRHHEPIVADTFAEADAVMTPILGRPLSSYIFIDSDDPTAVKQLEQQLLQTEITQPAVLATDLSMTRMLNAYGVWPDMCMGHSLGEYGALVAAGSLSFGAALEAVAARGHEMASLDVGDNGAMAAVFGPLEEIQRIVDATDGYVVVANINSFSQAVVGGDTESVERAIAAFGAAGITAARIPVSHAFHTSIVAPSSVPLRQVLRRLDVKPPVRPIVANVSGEFYPQGATVDTMVDILGQQVASPVQFVKGLQTLYDAGARVFVEVGPKKALHGFVEDVLGSRHDDVLALFTNHPKQGDIASFNQALCGLYASGLALNGPSTVPDTSSSVPAAATPTARPQETTTSISPPPASPQQPFGGIAEKVTEIGQIFADAVERGLAALAAPGAPASHGHAEASSEPPVITGASLGLPGVSKVFDDANIGRILSGQQFIGSIPPRIRSQMVDRHITRLVKSEFGEATFETISDESEVIKLAGRAAPFDVVTEFGVDAARDAALDDTTRLSIGAGIDALRDAGIPLVMRYRTTTLGTQLPDRWGLPDALRDETGVIFASAFPGYDQFGLDLQNYYTDRGRREQLLALEAVRARLTGAEPAAAEVDRRITELRRLLEAEPFTFDRRFIFRALSMGHSQFAELIGARGPNTQVNAACASTTQAIALAEDWIATGRCRRVVIVSADDVSSDVLLPWVGSGFLASGAAATDANVEDAATPFDRRRHGMIVGMGAAALVVESAEAARERGLQPICEVLSTVTLNSAFHGTRLDVSHVADTMEQLIAKAERRGIRRDDIAADTMFMSHETYTPARGGSAAAEITALRQVFGPQADQIVITNTKGFTGHAMGAGIEDVVAVKALETGIVPPVPNYREPDPSLGQLNLSTGGSYPVGYALRLAAGFGSQIAMALFHWTPMPSGQRTPVNQLGYQSRVLDQGTWQQWLDLINGKPGSKVEVVDRRLRVVDDVASAAPPAAAPPPAVATVPTPAPEPVAAPAPPPVAPPPPTPEPVAATDPVVDKVVAIVAGMTGYPPELLDVDLDLEADLGVDTVKQAEVFAAVREEFGVERDPNLQLRDFPTLTHVIGWVRDKTGIAAVAPAASAAAPAALAAPAATPDAAAPTAPPAAGGDPVVDKVVAIVAEMTGYPPELLDVDLDLEADLGVDTVKQAEVFAAVREEFGVERDPNLQLRDFPTLTHVIGWVRDKTGIPATTPTPAPAAATAAAPATAPAAAAPPAGGDPVVEKVTAIVAEMTGYPPELLDVDLDLEADLGVDTVKQAEVFAAVREEFGVERDPNLQLRDFPTLTHVIGWVRDKTGIPAGPSGAATAVADTAESPAATASTATSGVHASPAVKGDLAATDTLPRRVPVPSLRPSLDQCVPTGISLDGDSRVVVMKDSSGVGKALVKMLDKLGATVLELEPGVPTDDLIAAVEAFAAEGPVQGVYWLSAMDDEGSLDSLDLAGWREALRRRVKTLYATMRALYDHNPFLVSATRLGGYHGYNETGASSPMGGAVTGFTKAYQRERFDDRPLVKAVDFTPSRKTSALADVLIEETLRDPGCVEVGYADGARWTIGLAERPFPAEPGEGALVLSPDTVALVTGAAGSIVSAIVADLAEAAGGGTFHLLDLTPEPDPDDANLRAYITDVDSFKLQVAAELKARGERATPVVIERELAKYERSQAALAAIQAVQDAGGTVRYHAIDLTDPAQVGAVIDEIRGQSGRIDLLLHAAGALQDRPLPSKEPRMFDLVVDVKSDGWFNLLTAAADLPIGATVAFSSVAGRFGNSAQTDYAAANDLLCKTTSAFRTTRPGTKGYALDWTAWGGIGMATRGSVAKIMEMAGVEMLPPEAGVAWIRREVTAGTPAGEVVVAGKLGMMAAEPHETGGLDLETVSLEGTGPMVGEVVSASVLDGITIRTTLDPTEQPFLNDHRINGTSVFPGVMYMEAFAEASTLLLPGWHVVSVEHMDYLGALKFFRDEPRTLTVTALIRPDADNPDDLVAECTLSADRTLPGQDAPQRTVHGSGRVRLSATPRSAPSEAKPGRKGKSSLSDEQIYAVYFHGDAYQVLNSVWRAKGDGACGRFADDLPPNNLPADAPLLIGPRLAELCFQTAGIWETGRTGKMALPLHVGAWQVFGTPTEDGPLVCTVRQTESGFDCLVQKNDGTVVAQMTEYWTVVTPDPLPEDQAALLAQVMAD